VGSPARSIMPPVAAGPPTFNDDVSLTSADSTMSNKVRIRSRPGILPTAAAPPDAGSAAGLPEREKVAEMLLAFIDFIDIGESHCLCNRLLSHSR